MQQWCNMQQAPPNMVCDLCNNKSLVQTLSKAAHLLRGRIRLASCEIMRPNSAMEETLILNNYNFHDWEFELEALCSRNKAIDQISRFSWLSQTLNSSDKRLIMKYKTESITVERLVEGQMKEVIIIGAEKPYTWAIEVLRKAKVRGNSKKVEDLFTKRENAKDKIKALKISSCKYNLEEFYKRFDRAVVFASSIGCELPEKYLMKLFAEGVMEHKDLSARASMIDLDLELETFQNFTELKDSYAQLIQTRSDRQKILVDNGKAHFSKKTNTTSKRCYNCKGDHYVGECDKPILKCSGCGLIGHKIENCKRKKTSNVTRRTRF